MKKITVKRIKAISRKLSEQVKKAKNVDRILSLHKRCDKVQYLQNLHLNKNPDFKIENYKPLKITTMLKVMPWWKDQLEIRRYKIITHKSFCCPVTGEILDMNDSFIVRGNIVSSNGLENLLKKEPKILGMVNV